MNAKYGTRDKLMKNNKQISPKKFEELLSVLEQRFNKNINRHKNIDWSKITTILEKCFHAEVTNQKSKSSPSKLWSLSEMEASGGEPDLVAFDKKTNQIVFYDCAAESPSGRRSLCYDRHAWESRKENKPKNDALSMASAMGVELLDEKQYRELQLLGNFDIKTSSWIKTPNAIRELGGALFCDRRYNQVFVYHNGAESYYAARGFRASLKI